MDNERAGMPRWVKIAITVTAAVAVLLLVLLLSGQGHGPGRHVPSHGLGGTAPIAVRW